MYQFKLYTAGQRGKLGVEFAWAYMIVGENGAIVFKDSGFDEVGTENILEYGAIIKGIEKALEIGIDELLCMSFNRAIMYQLSGKFKVYEPDLLKLNGEVKKICSNLKKVEFERVGKNDKYVSACKYTCNRLIWDGRSMHVVP
jgi:ribonuclease HI